MSASSLTTIWCDNCGWWEHTGHNAAEARRRAKRSGWSVAMSPAPESPDPVESPTAASLWRPGQRRDLCPDCARQQLPNCSPHGA